MPWQAEALWPWPSWYFQRLLRLVFWLGLLPWRRPFVIVRAYPAISWNLPWLFTSLLYRKHYYTLGVSESFPTISSSSRQLLYIKTWCFHFLAFPFFIDFCLFSAQVDVMPAAARPSFALWAAGSFAICSVSSWDDLIAAKLVNQNRGCMCRRSIFFQLVDEPFDSKGRANLDLS